MGRILIADDHDAMRRGLVRGIADAGHEVEEASNGNAAIERLHDGYFDVVLSDLKMGGSDGLDVLHDAPPPDDGRHPDDRSARTTASGAMKSGARLRAEALEIEMEVKYRKAPGSRA